RRRGRINAFAGAVIADVQTEHVWAVVHADVDAARAGVLQNVGRRFLKDPVGGEIECRRQRLRLTVDTSIDLEAGRAQFLNEAGQLANPRLRAAIRGGAISAAQDAEQPVQLDE